MLKKCIIVREDQDERFFFFCSAKNHCRQRKHRSSASSLWAAGIAFSWARLGNVHAMSHPVSAYYDVPHGVANAILLPAVVDYNALADSGKYLKIYNYIAERPAKAEDFVPAMLGEEIRKLNKALGIPASLSEVGVTDEHLDAMADDAMKSGNIAVNPRATAKRDILDLYRKAL